MYQISSSVGNSIDSIMISSMIGTTTVGFLSNYSLIRKQIENIVKQFYYAVVPSIGNLAAEKNVEKQYVVFNRILYLSFLLVNFCATSLFTIFNPFICLWLGKKYVLGDNVSFIIALDFFLYIILQAVASFRTANRLFVKGQYRPLITAILNVFLTFLLVKKMGIFGAIFATVICRLLTQWYDPYVLFKYVFQKPFRFFYSNYWKYIVLFVTGAVLTNHIANMLCITNLVLDVVIRCVICVLIPNLWAILWTMRTEEFGYYIGLVLSKLKQKLKR